MKRRRFIYYTATGLLASGITSEVKAQTNVRKPKVSTAETVKPQNKPGEGLLIQWLGHTCFLLTGGGQRVLVNPFRAIGCTAGYKLPQVEADLVLISSQLWDEGAAENLPGNPKVLFEPGVYEIGNFKLQGISMFHDRVGGKRFGINVAWKWTQAGISIVHLGGAAAPVELEQKILLGSPDVAFIPVGGGPKAYSPEEAKQAMGILSPKIMIPTQFLTGAADKAKCDLVPVDNFLKLAQGMNIKSIDGDKLLVKKQDLPSKGTLIRVFSDKGLLKEGDDR
ncbi:MAG: hypothetical protein N5P05_003965 [Chroococcopsis gigantea SAG 12.99]|jgi:L-ascorbate metabolism protein UlaG (beta-lactamase superfamily)|nr:MBL fold metallo-hydrolase [Chlorogloea purpurea SAG 13.99]MDV3002359.1 hypothetical protein [Chroococcopsis gigantea SAG 12.99]